MTPGEKITETTRKKHKEWFKENHKVMLLTAIDKAYKDWYKYCYKKGENSENTMSFIYFLKDNYFTDEDIYHLLALGVLKVWLNKEDVFYEQNKAVEIDRLFGSGNKFGSVKIKIEIQLNDLPPTVEEYIQEQKELRNVYFNDGVNPVIEED